MKILISNLKAVQRGSYKAELGAGTFWKPKSELEPKHSAPQHCFYLGLIDYKAEGVGVISRV